jgi:hypothetical protein
MKIFKLVVIIYLILWNYTGYCQNGNNIVTEFNNARKQVDSNLSSHFPEIILLKAIGISVKPALESEYNEGLELSYAIALKKENLTILIDSLNKLRLPVFRLNSKKTFQIDRPYGEGTSNQKNCYPLPNYSRWAHSFFPDEKLPKDMRFYIIDAKAGEYLPKNLLTKGGGLPKEWKNGYSRGIAISKKTNTVIYWLVVW